MLIFSNNRTIVTKNGVDKDFKGVSKALLFFEFLFDGYREHAHIGHGQFKTHIVMGLNKH